MLMYVSPNASQDIKDGYTLSKTQTTQTTKDINTHKVSISQQLICHFLETYVYRYDNRNMVEFII